MKNKKIILSAAVALLMSGGLAFAGFDSTPKTQYVGPPFGSTLQPDYLSQQGEQVTTNVLLRQILAEVIRSNNLKEDRRCSDGENSTRRATSLRSTGKRCVVTAAMAIRSG